MRHGIGTACSGLIIAALAGAGCSRSQLRVVVPDPDFRAGTVQVTAIPAQAFAGPSQAYNFDALATAPANFVFRFDPPSRFAYLVNVYTTFVPAVRREHECILSCVHPVELVPGRSHRIETPIVILPNDCEHYIPMNATAHEAASALCDAAGSIVQIPNCEFVASGDRCILDCPGIPPEDPTPDEPTEGTMPTTQRQPPPQQTPDAGMDAGTTQDVFVPQDDVQPTPPAVCGGVDINCDGFADSWGCRTGQICDHGQCADTCIEGSCFAGNTCTAQNTCVQDSCRSVTCPAGQYCLNGACIDPCKGMSCAGGQVCRGGMCTTPCP